MDGMERLGYQVSVFLRVPDLGMGLDRAEERHHRDRDRDRHHHASRASLTRSNTHSGGSASGAVAIHPKSPRKSRSHARPRPLSGGSGVGGVGGVGDVFHAGGGGGGGGGSSLVKDAGEAAVAASAPSSYGTPTGALLHSAMLARAGAGAAGNAAANTTTPGVDSGGTPHRIRFREQGVDELLQLKLHQALAAEDDVPEGATIVLATGDGNVGQFNEEGFLGECPSSKGLG